MKKSVIAIPSIVITTLIYALVATTFFEMIMLLEKATLLLMIKHILNNQQKLNVNLLVQNLQKCVQQCVHKLQESINKIFSAIYNRYFLFFNLARVVIVIQLQQSANFFHILSLTLQNKNLQSNTFHISFSLNCLPSMDQIDMNNFYIS